MCRSALRFGTLGFPPVLFLLLISLPARAEDCNQNGIEDSLEIQGSFTAAQSIPLPPAYTPRDFATGDIDGDRLPDLVATLISGRRDGTQEIRVLRNDRTGGYAPDPPLPALPNEARVILADLDGDGDVDLLSLLEPGQNLIAVRRNRGDGTFEGESTTPVGGNLWWPYHPALGDLDGDGDPDLAIALRQEPEILLFRNDGRAGFEAAGKVDCGTWPVGLAAGDLDGDGRADLAVAGVSRDILTLLFPDPAGGFREPVRFRDESSFQEWGSGPIVATDLNRDGFLDLLEVGTGTEAYSFGLQAFLNDGRGGFDQKLRSTTRQYLGRLLSGDIDGDGLPDAAGLAYDEGQKVWLNALHVLFGDGAGRLGQEAVYTVDTASHLVAATDQEGDGDLDFLTGSATADHLLFHRIRGGVVLGEIQSLQGPPRSANLLAVDLDLDGREDLVTTGQDDLKPIIACFWNEGRGGFLRGTDLPWSANYSPLRAGDLDGDARPDLVGLRMLMNLGRREFQESYYLPVRDRGFHRFLDLADVDGDQDLDLIGHDWISPAAGEGTIGFFLNDGPGPFRRGPALPAGDEDVLLRAADVDGDGDLDLVAEVKHRFLEIHRNRGDGTFDSPTSREVSGGLWEPRPLDLDGDGLVDLVFPSEPAQRISFLFNLGSGEFGGGFSLEPLMGAADAYDREGDGLPDLAMASSQGVMVIANRGGRVFEPVEEPLRTQEISGIAASDFNGDGRADLAVGRWGGDLAIIFGGVAPLPDRNRDGVPDECQLAGNDCDEDRVPDDLELAGGEIDLGPITINNAPYSPGISAAEDLDGDGDFDLVAASGGVGGIFLYENDGRARFQQRGVIEPLGVNDAAAIDLDADGLPDLAVAWTDPQGPPPLSASRLVFHLNRGGWSFERAEGWLGVGPQPRAIEAADLDGDGGLDLVLLHELDDWQRSLAAGEPYPDLETFLAGGEAGMVPGEALVLGQRTSALAVRDLDGDGRPDLAVADHSGRLSVFRNRGGGSFASPESGDLSPVPRALSAQDLDGDGAVDLAAALDADPERLQARAAVLRNRGDGTFEDPRVFAVPDPLPGAAGAIGTFDADGDGDFDLVLGGSTSVVGERYGRPVIWVFENSGSLEFPTVLRFGAGDFPRGIAARDFNGDGAPDLAVAGGWGPGSLSILPNRTPRFSVPDCDGNGVLDSCDPDEDGDGINDACDLCPGEDDRRDADGDGSPDCLRIPLQHLVQSGAFRPFIRGDANESGKVDLSDAITILDRLFLSDDLPACARTEDVNGDRTVDISDPISLLAFLFLSGPAIPEPYPDCGHDLERDDLGCGSFPPCGNL